MALGYLDDSKLTAVANAIRDKTGDSATMTVDEMPTEIASISGGGAPKVGVLRPDAELWKSWTLDETVTLPSYTTSNATLINSSALSDITLSTTRYDYFLAYRDLVYPIYSSPMAAGQGKPEYSFFEYACEIVRIPANKLYPRTGSATTIPSSSVASVKTTNITGCLYWTSGSAVSLATASAPIWTTFTAPTYTDSSSALKITLPKFLTKGSSSYFKQTYWDAISGMRIQYIMELYRVEKNGDYFNGYAIGSLASKSIDSIHTASGTLT